MKTILFATGNESKGKRFTPGLNSKGIGVITLKDIDKEIDVKEDGKTAIENAIIKAKAYNEVTNYITLGMDDTLYLEGVPEKDQPGLFVRRVNGKRLDDEEMIEHYVGLVKKYGHDGKLFAKWIYGMAITDGKRTETYTWEKGGFYFTDKVHPRRDVGYPLNSISINEVVNKYFIDMTEEDKEKVKQDETDVVEFISNFVNGKSMNEKEFYDSVGNWDFSQIKYDVENLTKWDMIEILKEYATKDSKILDLGTGGGEKVLKYYPKVKEILATDFSEEMITTANKSLKKTKKDYITFRVMDNLNMDTPANYFDIVTARHTCIDAKQIYKTLKPGGVLILRGVDKADCLDLKMLFGKGQCYRDKEPISIIDYKNIIEAGFKDVELVPICIREYYYSKEDLLALLLKVPILDDFSEEEVNNFEHGKIDLKLLEKYIEDNTYNGKILLRRRYYGITARKR